MAHPSSESRPFFSIVMPTREKAHLLQHALRSAVSQTFEDYEIVVCDNLSMDDTVEVVRGFADEDERIRHVRTEERLSMPDNWEFAFEHARGEYVTYLCDDDAISPHLLERLYEVLAGRSHISVGWRGGMYFHPDWPEKEARGSLLLTGAATGKVLEFSSSSLLEKLFNLEYQEQYPRLLNSCCSREFLERRKRRMGRLFLPTCPDYSVAVATLTGTESVLYIDEYLAAFGFASMGNMSYGFADTNAIQVFMSEFSEPEKIWRIPLKSNTSYNHIAVTLIGLKDVLAEELAPYSVSIATLFVREYQEIELMKSRGADVSQARKEWSRALATQNTETQRTVRKAMSPSFPESVLRRLKAATKKRFPAAVYGMHSVRGSLKERGVPVKGPVRYRFDNIFEAAGALGKFS